MSSFFDTLRFQFGRVVVNCFTHRFAARIPHSAVQVNAVASAEDLLDFGNGRCAGITIYRG